MNQQQLKGVELKQLALDDVSRGGTLLQNTKLRIPLQIA